MSKEKIGEVKWPEGPEIIDEADVSKKEITAKDMLKRVHVHIDKAQEGIDEEFKTDSQRIFKKENDYFICKNKFWDLWFQKLFAQLISVKIWMVTLITVLLSCSLITNIQFASILGIIVGLKGTFQVASVWKKNGNGNGESAMDKT